MKAHLPSMVLAYVTCALWSSVDGDDQPLDDNYTAADICPDTLDRMARDCRKFATANGHDIAGSEGAAGHDFWLTRNQHGAGFWDGDWQADAGERLTQASKAFGTFDLYVDDDGIIRGSRI